MHPSCEKKIEVGSKNKNVVSTMRKWMYGVRGVIRLDRIIRNKYIRSSLKIASIYYGTIRNNRL